MDLFWGFIRHWESASCPHFSFLAFGLARRWHSKRRLMDLFAGALGCFKVLAFRSALFLPDA